MAEEDDPAILPWKVLKRRKYANTDWWCGGTRGLASSGHSGRVPVRAPVLIPDPSFRRGEVRISQGRSSVVRNGHGVVRDLNENAVTTLGNGSGPHRPRVRCHYRCAIFSTSGFTQDAQEFALAHQISLVDLSLPDFQPLRDLVGTAAKTVYNATKSMPSSQHPRGAHAHVPGGLGTCTWALTWTVLGRGEARRHCSP